MSDDATPEATFTRDVAPAISGLSAELDRRQAVIDAAIAHVQAGTVDAWRNLKLAVDDLIANPTAPVRIVTTDPGAVGRCGASPPTVPWPSTRTYACALPTGHAGWHKDGITEWSEHAPPLTDAEKAAYLRADAELNGPAGLSAEQEIRARALDFAARFHDPPADTVLLAVQFAGWIRDGSVPE